VVGGLAVAYLVLRRGPREDPDTVEPDPDRLEEEAAVRAEGADPAVDVQAPSASGVTGNEAPGRPGSLPAAAEDATTWEGGSTAEQGGSAVPRPPG
ncbi:MAG: hypothetical protein JWL64_2494, partial [Frankiales bacterium]|nr:hypothetical protein [Frankiales bacterium]